MTDDTARVNVERVRERLRECFDEMLQAFPENPVEALALLRALGWNLRAVVLRDILENGHGDSINGKGELTVTALARAVGMSRRQLYRAIERRGVGEFSLVAPEPNDESDT